MRKSGRFYDRPRTHLQEVTRERICGVKLNVDGNEMNPNAGNDYDFDNSATGKTVQAH